MSKNMNHKNLENRQFCKKNYYAVSDKEGYVNKITEKEMPFIKKTGQYEFTITYDCADHKVMCPCKIVVEEITTQKKFYEI